MAIVQNALYANVAQKVRHRVETQLENFTDIVPDLCMTVPSDTDIEEYDWMGAMPTVVEWLGDQTFSQIRSAGHTLRNRDWVNGIRLPKKKIDDGKTGYFDNLADRLAGTFRKHPSGLLLDMMAELETIECFDGQPFFDTDHEFGDSGLQSNLVTVEIADVDNPTLTEIREAVHAVLKNMLTYRNDRGELYTFPTAQPFEGVTIYCSLDDWELFNEAFTSALKITVEGSVNGVTNNYTLVNPTIVPLIGQSSGYFDVYRSEGDAKPFVFQDRQKVRIGDKFVTDVLEKDIVIGGNARYAIGPMLWWLATRCKWAQEA
ncbi:Mu-like prophage major head subunit gpT family protein [Aporhodopirellula aestuarii]|uniref:Mu-like prophage major head subunit gpT family protein n=1 Tax=Aporhodopirellula aestuarii TaxID=2950107 RepID=A0ABT0UAH6_9BACT|nr:Mu-like prophage major head subunit gpT family protein [Aporhodopirellula aestuarii]MCM2373908.1 Mu-like prophage major head subunit gpT family protein [Aporhodopirellula aestuarii]